nr:MAG TPA: CotH kinase protein [Caudoviricetes sp.]
MFDKDNKFGFINNNNENNNIDGLDNIKTDIKNIKNDVDELNTQYKDIVSKIENGNIGNNIEPQLMDMPRIYFSEGTLPTSKTATVMKFDYYSKTNEYHGYVDIKCQGTSSMGYPKKNFTIKPYKDKAKTSKLKIDFKGWGKQSKFVLKANWIDISHLRNVVSARLWGDIVKTRADYTTALPELLRTSPNQGAIDGFPVLVYSNGVYQGRYTLNIPKDKWMSNMDDTLDTHCILCGENYQSGCFRALPQINGNDWTDELHDVVPANIKTSWSNAINFVMTSSDTDFKANLSNYFDVNSLIDYYLYGLVATHLDGFGKNQLFFSYDGIHWIASIYDVDSTWGLYWNGSRILPTDYRRNQYEDYVNKTSNLLYDRLEQLYMTQLKARYAELRKDVLSASHIIQKFEEFNDVCPKDIVQEDYASTTGGGKFTGIPSTTTNNIQQLRNNIVGRLTYVDGYINALQEAIPCTNITLNKTELTFTTSDAQTLTATLTPENTTDTVAWSVNPTGICTVENGIVTPIKNGTCVITATCGTQSATCNVTVNLPVQAVTALNLDKDSITLGNSADADTSNVNLLEGVNHTIDTTTNNIVFDSITLDSGIYTFKNINGGSFTWLGADYDGSKHELGNTSEDFLFKFNNSTIAQFHAFPNNKATNTADKLGLYKISTTLTNPIKFTLAGHGYYNNGNLIEDDNNVYSNTVNLDTSKKYVLMNEGANQINQGYCAWKIDNGSGGKNVSTVLTNHPIKVFENVTSLSISINTVNNTLADLSLYEISTGSVTKFEDTLTSTLTPANATNKNVTWTADNENVELVANGLNCTVKAKAVGDSIVTCTSQDTTNGTITDTCNVTINAIPEQPNVLYTLPQETTFNGTSDYVDTGVKLFDTDKDFTIFMDFTSDQTH